MRTLTGLAIFCLAAGLLQGCSTQSLQTDYNPATDARIRVFSLPNNTWLYSGKNCFATDDPDRIIAHSGGRDFGLVNSLSVLASNRRIGMPQTKDMPFTYHEFIVPAGKPLIIASSINTQTEARIKKESPTITSTRCGPIGVTFVPQPGQDYDTAFELKGYGCEIRVRRLIPDSRETADTEKVPFASAPECSKGW